MAMRQVALEAWLAERLREWFLSEWQGDVTLSFPGSIGVVSFVKETRRSLARTEPTVALWGDIRFGSTKVSFQGGQRHVIEEVRTTTRPTSQACGRPSEAGDCCARHYWAVLKTRENCDDGGMCERRGA